MPFYRPCQIPELLYREALQDCDHLSLEEKYYYENNRALG
jgi:hypothetical protein